MAAKAPQNTSPVHSHQTVVVPVRTYRAAQGHIPPASTGDDGSGQGNVQSAREGRNALHPVARFGRWLGSWSFTGRSGSENTSSPGRTLDSGREVPLYGFQWNAKAL
jgi:hypothetical protein